METTAKKSRSLYWILFFISVLLFFVTYHFAGGYCSMILPLVVTTFAMALDLL